MKRSILLAFFLLLSLCVPHSAHAALHVFACEPEWGALSTELGGDKVSVYNATTGQQDPHQIQARPSLIAKARQADITVCDGAELEIGWLPLILQQANNPKIQPNQPGAFDASSFVPLLEQPVAFDRAL
ncbi:MAG TPA: zinc ABC transporter substrate-binding protein, partial [Phenylobacterium sp.]